MVSFKMQVTYFVGLHIEHKMRKLRATIKFCGFLFKILVINKINWFVTLFIDTYLQVIQF